MDSRFENIHKILGNLPVGTLSYLVNCKGEEIQETSIYNAEDGSFNKELLTKEGFLKNIFGNTENNKYTEKTKAFFENLYDAIANMDGDGKMSEEEIKFLASLGENSKGTIDKRDFEALGILNRDINKFAKKNSKSTILDKAEVHIDSTAQVSQQEEVTGENENLGINGRIDEPVIQGTIGDCWLLSGINALNSTEKGKQIIRNAIIPNENGFVTINFAGIGKQITLSSEEIKKNDTDLNFHDNYSNGDNDALVLELAMQKLIEENPTLFSELDAGINGGKTYSLWKALVPNYHIVELKDVNNNCSNNDDSKSSISTMDSGHSAVFYEKIEQILTQAISNKNIAMEFATGGHSMAITNIEKDKLTYIDSMDYTERTVSWDYFINLISSFSYIDLDKKE